MVFSRLKWRVVEMRRSMYQMVVHVAWPEVLPGIEMDQRSMIQDVLRNLYHFLPVITIWQYPSLFFKTAQIDLICVFVMRRNLLLAFARPSRLVQMCYPTHTEPVTCFPV